MLRSNAQREGLCFPWLRPIASGLPPWDTFERSQPPFGGKMLAPPRKSGTVARSSTRRHFEPPRLYREFGIVNHGFQPEVDSKSPGDSEGEHEFAALCE